MLLEQQITRQSALALGIAIIRYKVGSAEKTELPALAQGANLRPFNQRS